MGDLKARLSTLTGNGRGSKSDRPKPLFVKKVKAKVTRRKKHIRLVKHVLNFTLILSGYYLLAYFVLVADLTLDFLAEE